jgi:2-isopropylmalate synthase
MNIQIYDTTLRDGTQSEGFNLSANDKVRIAQKLDNLGVAFIEGGWPGSNPKDVEFFERARDMDWKTAKIAAFGATCRVKGGPEDDANIKALLESKTPVCTIFGKTWTLHVTDVLLTTLEDNLRIIEQSVAYLRANDRRVIYDAEHFFDGYRADNAYAIETLKAAIRGGAETVVLCDTNGGTMPWDVEKIIREVRAAIQHPFGIHTHNDGECAVVNTLTAVREGAIQVQGTIKRCRRALRQRQSRLHRG